MCVGHRSRKIIEKNIYIRNSERGWHTRKVRCCSWWNECDRLSIQLRWLPLLLLPFSSTLRATVVVVVVVRSRLLSTHVRLFRNDIYVHFPGRRELWLACDSNFAIFSGHTMMTTTQKAAAAAAHGHRLVQSRYIKFSVARSTHMRKAKFICEENPLR